MTVASGTNAAPADVTIVAHEVHRLGGMEKQLTELVLGLLRRGFPVTVVARRCELDPAGAGAVRWVRVPGPARPFSLAYPWFLLAGSWLVHRHRRGLVHTTGAIVLNHSDVSTVHFCHRALAAQGPSPARARSSGAFYRLNAALAGLMSRWLEWLYYHPRSVRHLVAVSEGGAGEVRLHFPAMAAGVSAIPNGVDLDAFRPDPASRVEVRRQLGLGEAGLVAIFVGGDWERKGLRHAIEATRDSPDCHLLVVGDGDVESLRTSGRSGGCGPRVHFLGVRRDVNRCLAAADAFVFPTSYENFPLAALEAAAAGLPLLATRVNGIADLLEDGENGWFIERDAGCIRQKLSRLRSDPGLREAMGARSRLRAARYSWERMVDGYVRLYSQLDASSPPGAAQPEGSLQEKARR